MDVLYSFVCIANKVISRLWLHFEVKLIGMERLPPTGPLIIAPNHVSYLDPPLLSAAWWPLKLDFFASSHLYRPALLGWFLRNVRTHPLVRENGLQALRQALKFLSQNKMIVLFPEGTRSKSGRMGPLKKGIAMLSCKAKASVVPVFISGAYEVWPPGRKYPRLFHKTKVTMCVGAPLPPCPEEEEKYAEWLAQLKEAYAHLEKKSKELS